MTNEWHLAQINIATALYDENDPRISRFYAQLDEINALAEASDGFVWRLQSESGNATDIQIGDDPRLIINMSVWESVDALFEFAYKTAHRGVLADRRQWFKRPEGAYQAMWWVPAGHRPTAEEGMARLNQLRNEGPSAAVFTFRSKYPPPGIGGSPEDMKPEPYCSGWE